MHALADTHPPCPRTPPLPRPSLSTLAQALGNQLLALLGISARRRDGSGKPFNVVAIYNTMVELARARKDAQQHIQEALAKLREIFDRRAHFIADGNLLYVSRI